MNDLKRDVNIERSGGSVDSNSLIINDEINLAYLFSLLWQGKWVVLAIALLFSLFSVYYAQSLPNMYKSEALLSPTSDTAKSGGLASQLGGLANIAGISLGGSATDKTTMALAVLKSRTFLDAFVVKYSLDKPIMFAEGWSETSKQWRYSDSFDESKDQEYSGQKLYRKLSGEILKASQDPKSGLVRISVELMSPEEAQRWLTLLIHDLNAELRQRDISEANKRIGFLRDQLEKTDVAQMQQVFFQLIEQQLKTVMLAEVGEEYVFKLIDKPVVPEEKSKPHRALIVVSGLLLGFIVGTFFVVVLAARKNID